MQKCAKTFLIYFFKYLYLLLLDLEALRRSRCELLVFIRAGLIYLVLEFTITKKKKKKKEHLNYYTIKAEASV